MSPTGRQRLRHPYNRICKKSGENRIDPRDGIRIREMARRVYIDAAEAAKGGDHVPDVRGPASEPECAAAKAAEPTEVSDVALFHDGAGAINREGTSIEWLQRD